MRLAAEQVCREQGRAFVVVVWLGNGIRIQDFYVPGACSFISCPSSLKNRSQSERAEGAGAADGPTVAGDPRYQPEEHRRRGPR